MLAMRTSPVGQREAELVERVRAVLVAHTVESGDEVRREDGGERLAQRVDARLRVHDLHLRVPALDPVVEVDGEDADVDRLDDVLVELLQALELGDLLLEPPVELRVLDGDADVAGQRFEQLHVFAGEEVAVVGAAQANHGDRARAAALAIGDAAGKVVVQVEPACAAALRLGQAQDLLGIFEEDMVVSARPVEVEEAHIERSQIGGLQIREAVRGGQIKVPGAAIGSSLSVREEDGDAGYKQRLRQPLDDGVEQRAQVGLRVEAAAKLDQGLAVVEALLIEDAVDPSLNRALQRIEDEAGDDDGCEQAPYAEGWGSRAVNDLRR